MEVAAATRIHGFNGPQREFIILAAISTLSVKRVFYHTKP
jgi:hypothetical protein